MSDDLHIPAPAGRVPVNASYRARRARPEPGVRTMAIAAFALGGLLLAGLGGWAVMGRRTAVVPVIEADSRPIRVKPENAGGMQVAGADELVLGDQAGGNNRMAPAAEVPAPQALRAQMQQDAPALPPAPSALPSPASVAAGPVSPATPAPLSAAAAPPPDAMPRPVVTAREAAPRPATGGTTQVQLAAVDSEAAARAEWQRLAKRMPDLLSDRRPSIQKAERDGHPIWRVRTGGFADIAEATGFCTKLRAKGSSCAIANF